MPLSVSLWNDLSYHVLDGVGLAGFKSRANAFLHVGVICSFFLSPTIFSFFYFHGLVVWDWGLQIDSVLTLFRPCTADSILIITIIRRRICACKYIINCYSNYISVLGDFSPTLKKILH